MSRIRVNHARGIVIAILVLLFFICRTKVVLAEEIEETIEQVLDEVAEETEVGEAADEVAEEATDGVAEEAEAGESTDEYTEPEETLEEPEAEAADTELGATEDAVAEEDTDETAEEPELTGESETVVISSFESFGYGDAELELDRIYGDNRYETSLAVAEALKEELGVSKFDRITLATGESYADALSGAYFSKVYTSPIILINDATSDRIINYVKSNLVDGTGVVYILGGEKAVSSKIADTVSQFAGRVKRIYGADRYETNLAILDEVDANLKDEVAVVSGKSFADALSASALDMPLLLAGDKLTNAQINYFTSGNYERTFYIIGGTAAVNSTVERELDSLGWSERVYGSDRYGTSVAVAQAFFRGQQDEVIVASGTNFPDGVSGGPLAQQKGVPLLLISDSQSAINRIKNYLSNAGVETVIGLGGEQAFKTTSVTGGNKSSQVYKGIDVSVFNGWIDWDAVANDDIDFAFVRVGGRFGASGLLYDDTRARENLAGAIRAGLKVGAYFFTQAVNVSEAVQEANYILNAVKGFDIELPLVIDTEYLGGGRHDYLYASTRTSVVRAFCDTIREAGYQPMIYSNTDWLENNLNMEDLSDIPVWAAEWGYRCNYSGEYVCWQYSESGWVDGIDGYVDMNYWYGAM